MSDAPNAENRKYIRFTNNNVLKCRKYSLQSGASQTEINAVVKNMSAGGVLFESSKQYQINDLLKLEIDLPGWEKFKAEFYKGNRVSQPAPVSVLASVVRVEVMKPGKLFDIGACFVGIDDGHQWALIKYSKNRMKYGDNG